MKISKYAHLLKKPKCQTFCETYCLTVAGKDGHRTYTHTERRVSPQTRFKVISLEEVHNGTGTIELVAISFLDEGHGNKVGATEIIWVGHIRIV